MATKKRPYKYYDATISLCSECLRRVDAKIVFQQGAVWMLKRCPVHGAERVMIADDIDYYKSTREVFIKTPEQVHRYNTPSKYGCPYDCGICPDHEQHGCSLLLEITDNCNLSCPTCFAGSCPEKTNHLSLEQIERMLDVAVANENEPAILQLSGGEPTVHPEFFKILEMVKARPIQHVLINTNGIKIAKEPGFAERLAEFVPGFEVYLQFDSLHRDALQVMRGADLTGIHQQALKKLNQLNIPTTLVATVRRGVNDQQLGEIIDFALTQSCVRGVTFQPVQAAGRLENYEDGYNCHRDRITLTEVRRKILQQTDLFEPQDIIPVPCFSDSLAMAYALRLKATGEDTLPGLEIAQDTQSQNGQSQQKLVALTGLLDPDLLINAGRNTIAYENDPAIRDGIFNLFSTHHSPISQPQAMNELLTAAAGTSVTELTYKNVFRVLIVDFMDAHNFDIRSIRKSCVHILHPDGKRAIPFETYNMLYRDALENTLLADIRRERESNTCRGPISCKILG